MATINFKSFVFAYLLAFMPYSASASSNVQPESNIDNVMSMINKKLQYEVSCSNIKIKNLQTEINESRREIDSLEKRINELQTSIEINQSETSKKIAANNLSINDVRNSIKDKTFMYGIGIGVVLLILVIVSFVLRRKLAKNLMELFEMKNVQKTLQEGQQQIEDNSLSLDTKVTDALNNQLSVMQQVNSQDHTLAFKIADEIVRIETNLYRMDPATRGYKQLCKSIQRMKDCFMSKGYEISDLLGKPYNEGMKVVANFVVDETLKEGDAIITGVIKPQIIYNGKMIQAAQITVSQNI